MYKVRENSDVTFTLKLSGTPKPESEWYKSQKIIKKGPRIVKTSDDHSASLTIKNVVEADVGEYTIRAKNPRGEAEASLTLVIISKYRYKLIIPCKIISYISVSHQKNQLLLVHLSLWMFQMTH